MKRSIARSLILILSLAGSSACTDAPTVPPKPPVAVPTPASRTPAAPPRGTATLHGVVIGAGDAPIRGATIRLSPYGLTAASDLAGAFAFPAIRVPQDCVWATITVRAAGYASWRSRDDALYSGQDHTLDVSLGHEVVDDFVGPPLADPNMKCDRRVAPPLRPPVIAEGFTLLPCPRTADTTLDMEGCAQVAIRRSDAKIDSLVREIFFTLRDDEARARFVRAERAWFAFRDADCESAGDVNEGGSLASVDTLVCDEDRNEQRIRELRQMLRDLQRV